MYKIKRLFRIIGITTLSISLLAMITVAIVTKNEYSPKLFLIGLRIFSIIGMVSFFGLFVLNLGEVVARYTRIYLSPNKNNIIDNSEIVA